MAVRYFVAGAMLLALPSAIVIAATPSQGVPPTPLEVVRAVEADAAREGASLARVTVGACRAFDGSLYGGTVYSCRVGFERTGAQGERAVVDQSLALTRFDRVWSVVAKR